MHIEESLKAGEKWYFVTLTSNAKARGMRKSVWVWRHAWPKLYARAKRAAGAFDYCLLPEAHKDGTLHVHIITSAALTQRWYKDNAAECGLGYQSDCQPVRSAKQAAGYVTKYVTKGLRDANWPVGFRRVRVSRGWTKRPGKGMPDGAQVVRGVEELKEVCAEMRNRNVTAIWAETGELVVSGTGSKIKRF